MYISTNSSSQPLSTSVIQRAGSAVQSNVVAAQTDPSLTTPEDINHAVDKMEQRVIEANASRQAKNQHKRDFAEQLSIQRNQQQQLEIYSSIVNEQGGVQSDNVVYINQQPDVNLVKRSTLELPEPPQVQPVTANQRLQNSIDQMLGNSSPALGLSTYA